MFGLIWKWNYISAALRYALALPYGVGWAKRSVPTQFSTRYGGVGMAHCSVGTLRFAHPTFSSRHDLEMKVHLAADSEPDFSRPNAHAARNYQAVWVNTKSAFSSAARSAWLNSTQAFFSA